MRRRQRRAARRIGQLAAAASRLAAATSLLAAATSLLAAAALASLLAVAACARPRAGERAAPALPAAHNVVFILVDTLRADHLPLYGYGRDTSPNLTALGRESLVFQAARSQSSCTFPSVNSILTSRSASAFLGQPGGAMGLPAAIPGLAELLHARGFHTAAVSASPIVRASPGRFNPGGGYGRGFDSFQEDCVWKGADCVTGQALPHLGGDPRPLFLYLHYLDPHGPYAPPAGWRPRFALGHPDQDFVRRGDPNPIAHWLYQGGSDPRVSAADLAYLVDLYDDKIAFFDAQLGRLLAALRAAGVLDDTLLVLAADHGEEFLEHGDIKHCRNLFDTTIRTPLLLRVPGARPRTVAEPVENLDIVPTLLDLLAGGRAAAGGPAPAGGGTSDGAVAGRAVAGLGPTGGASAKGAPAGEAAAVAGFEGRSLRPAATGRPLPPRLQRAAQGPLRSVSDGRFKLVRDLASGRFALYDLAADPRESRDVLGQRRSDFYRLRDALDAWLARSEGRPPGDRLRRADDAAARLRALGYLD